MLDIKTADKKSFDEFVGELMEKNYAEVPFNVSRAKLETAAERFFDHLQLPQEEKEALHFYDRPENRQGIGYVRKSGEADEAGRTDYKEYFHYHPKLLTQFAGSSLLERPETKTYLEAAQEIYEEGLIESKRIFKIISLEFPNFYTRFFPKTEAYMEYSALRFLKYEPSGQGNFLARAHYDRGCTTLALAESAPGLRIGKDEANLKEVSHKDGVALFMPAYQLPELTDMRFRPAWHDVVQSSEDVYRENAARWAIVFFSDAEGVATPSKEESHVVIG
jgi:isopenicillin N synthase-like dioxygenase